MTLRPTSSPRPAVYLAVESSTSQLPSPIPKFLCMRSRLCWLAKDVAGIQDQGQTLLSSRPCFPGLDSFFLLTFLSHSITLIVLSSEEGTSELRLERLLQMVFGAMVRLPSPLPQTQKSELSASFSLTPGVQIHTQPRLSYLVLLGSSCRTRRTDQYPQRRETEEGVEGEAAGCERGS